MDRREQLRPNPPGNPSSIERLGSRLDSWKEIASYLGRSEKTVRRWEDSEELPVHRLLHEKRGSVYAYTSELDAWREMRKTAIESEAVPGDGGAHGEAHNRAKTDSQDIPAPGLESTEERVHLPARRLRPSLLYLITIAGISLLVLLVGMYWGRLRDLVARGPNAVRIQSLAVLPLENLSGDPEQEYFADGMTAELITELGKIGSLRVISRTSVMRYKHTRKPLAEIARELNADALVEAEVLKSERRVRVTAQLIQTATDRHLWAETYERDLQDIMVLQDDLARQIANEVQVKLTPQEQVRLANAHPVSPQAHEAYLKGRYLFSQRTDQGMRKSIGFLQQAIDFDSHYALAYAGLADSYLVLTTYGLLRPDEAYPKVEQAAKKALEIDETLAEAHTTLGYARTCYDRDWPAAEREFRRALQLNMNYATAHHWYAEHLAILGQAQQAVAEVKRARELDPLSLVVNATFGRILYDARHFDEAVEQCRKTIDLDPNFAHGHWCLGLAYLGKARHNDAILELQKARALGEGPVALWALGHAYAVAGRKPKRERF